MWDDNSKMLKMNAGSYYIPKDSIKTPKGEDAHFISDDKNTIGLADGVGGWAAKGIDAGKYARLLMINSLKALEDEIKGYVILSKVLEKAYMDTKVRGSLTACIISFNCGKFLDYANVGDSGLMVFRDGKMMYRSPVQRHGFNHPYQLGRLSSDKPSSAYQEIIVVKEGDIVVAGTDGLFDNMYASEILEILEEECDKDPEDLASMIAENALLNSLDEDYFSPFSEAAEKAGLNLQGGKYDDITVIVAGIE